MTMKWKTKTTKTTKSALGALLASVLLAVAASGQARDPRLGDDAESLVYPAFYAEVALRDFAAAEKAYASAIVELAKRKDVDALVKARVGRARCLAALGRKDDAKGELELALKVKPGDAESTKALEQLSAPDATSERIVEQVQRLLAKMEFDGQYNAAMQSFARMGDVAVPVLAEWLRSDDANLVSRAARALGWIGTRASMEGIAAALADPALPYVAAVLEGLVADGNTQIEVSTITLPAFLAALGRKETELREKVAKGLANYGLRNSRDESASVLIERMSSDPSERVRDFAFDTTLSGPAADAILPLLRRMLDSKSVDERRRAARFVRQNTDYMPRREVVDEFVAKLKRDSDPEIRANALLTECKTFLSIRDLPGAVAPVLQLLADDDPNVFVYGAELLQQVRRQVPPSSHEILARALVRCIEDPSLSDRARKELADEAEHLPLSDEELVDLYVRAGGPKRAWNEASLVDLRENLVKTWSRRFDGTEPLGTLAAETLPRIPDAAGRRLWFQRLSSKSEYGLRSLRLAAANDADSSLRRSAYGTINAGFGPSTVLTRLQEDLATLDDRTLRRVLESLTPSLDPALVAPLRELLDKSKGATRVAVIRAFGVAGGDAVADELIASMRATPRGETFPSVDALERARGLGVVPELIAVAKERGSASEVVNWLLNPERSFVSTAFLDQFARDLPPELLGPYELPFLARFVTMPVATELVQRAIRSGDREMQLAAVQTAKDQRIDSVWDDLIRLLDTGDGELRQAATDALRELKSYRELRGVVTFPDADARRAAFEKAKKMLASPDVYQRKGAALALGALGEVAAVPLLLNLMEDVNIDVRGAACTALEKLSVAPAPAPAPGSPPAKTEK